MHGKIVSQATSLAPTPPYDRTTKAASGKRSPIWPVTDVMEAPLQVQATTQTMGPCRPPILATAIRQSKQGGAALWATGCGYVAHVGRALGWALAAALAFLRKAFGLLPQGEGSYPPACGSFAPPRTQTAPARGRSVTVIRYQAARASRTLATVRHTLQARTQQMVRLHKRLKQRTHDLKKSEAKVATLHLAWAKNEGALEAAMAHGQQQLTVIMALQQQVEAQQAKQHTLRNLLVQHATATREAKAAEHEAQQAYNQAVGAENAAQRQMQRSARNLATVVQQAEDAETAHADERNAMGQTIADLRRALAYRAHRSASPAPAPAPERAPEPKPEHDPADAGAQGSARPATLGFAKPQSPRAARKRALSAQAGSSQRVIKRQKPELLVP